MNLSQSFFAIAACLMVFMMLGMIWRVIIGPTTGDRLLAYDAMHTMVIGVMLILSVVYDSVVIADVAIVYTTLAFVSILYFARRMEGGI